MPTRSDARADRIEHEIAEAARELAPDCALAAVMSAVTRRMSRGEARRIIDALPARHRAFLAHVARDREEAPEPLGRAEIARAIAAELGLDEQGAEHLARAVLAAVGRALPQGLLTKALAQLPPDVAHLFRTRSEGPVAGPVPIRPRAIDAGVAPRETALDHAMTRRLEAMHAVPPGFTGASTLSAAMCELARRLPRGEAAHLVRALPEAVRPLLEACVAAREESPAPGSRDELLDRLAERFEVDRPSAELSLRAVFRVVQDELSQADVRHVESQLPEDIADIWRLGQTRLTEVRSVEKPRRAAERAARAGTARPR